MEYSNLNTLSGNTADENHNGILLKNSDHNTINNSNSINENEFDGISLEDSNNNTITSNSIRNNYVGIYLENSSYNSVNDNILSGNGRCIEEEDCEGNVIENNDCGEEEPIIFGYNLLFLMGIISLISIILIKKQFKN